MSVTAQQVFDLAVQLMGAADRSSGRTDTADTAEYKNRTLAILNVLQSECLTCSDTYSPGEGGARPVGPLVEDFATYLALDDGICLGALPYGLAAHLLLEENPSSAAYFNDRYEQRRTDLKNSVPRRFEPIETVYGGIEFGRFSSW